MYKLVYFNMTISFFKEFRMKIIDLCRRFRDILPERCGLNQKEVWSKHALIGNNVHMRKSF